MPARPRRALCARGKTLLGSPNSFGRVATELYALDPVLPLASHLNRIASHHDLDHELTATMSYAHHRQTTLPSHLSRPSSGFGGSAGKSQSSALQARINEKKVELENLRQLRDLSGGLAGQMQQLEEKLSTLSSGTEAVAAVMGNWNNVLRAVHMASGEYFLSLLLLLNLFPLVETEEHGCG